MLGSLVLAACAQAPQQAPLAPTDLFAMTRSGLQVEVAVRPQRGALDLETPFGLYYTPTDPVVSVLERKRDRSWAATVRSAPDASLLPAIEMFADNGQVSALLEMAPVVVQRAREDEVRHLFTSLEVWGARFDPAPRDLDRAERVEWYWERVEEGEGWPRLLMGARLASEVTPGGNGVGPGQLTLTTLSRAMESTDPLVRRVCLLVTRRQLMNEAFFNARILYGSLYEHVLVRDLAGSTSVRLRPEATREYWVKALLRADDAVRLQAAIQLAEHLPDYAPKAFTLLLAVGDRKAPTRFEFLDIKAQVVVDRRDPLPLRQLQFAFSNGGNERNEHLANASTVKLVRIEPALRQLMIRLLTGIAADDVDRSVEEWLEWYKKRQIAP